MFVEQFDEYGTLRSFFKNPRDHGHAEFSDRLRAVSCTSNPLVNSINYPGLEKSGLL